MAEYPFKHSIVNTDDNKQALLTANHVMTESGIWIPQRGSDDGATHTQVTGSNDEFIWKREIISGSRNRDVVPPYKAVGAIFSLVSYGLTGELSAGYRLILRGSTKLPRIYTSNRTLEASTTRDSSGSSGHFIFIHPDSGYMDILFNEVSGNKYVEKRNTYLPDVINVEVNFSGTFNLGEGLDSEVKVTWLY